ncbi:orotidine-5'-phosphate decarboxylase [Nakamurella lactea]|uniref:orotidine-5'-phosphate decarboxylase n=1 Tax=Nakamurella lactea TaxID=459515 RepID=UPI00042992B2|nr:orotidine-5'-phosphate decarboxylase [Nakamurella lactea]
MTDTSFGERLGAAVADRGSFCPGIDPHPELLRSWGLDVDAAGLERFALTAAEAFGDTAAIVKPQSAFFEAFGSAGVAVLERTIATLQSAGALVLLDAKRGDIGSTMAAYAAAYLTDGSPLAADALTVSPFLGFGSLEPAVAAARNSGRGLFVLCRTSNPLSEQVQRAVGADGRAIAQVMVDEVAALNAGTSPGSFGLVIGATVGRLDVDLSALNGPVLAPGIGAQGAGIDDLRTVFGDLLPSVLPNSSRQVLAAGPSVQALRDAVSRQNAALRA